MVKIKYTSVGCIFATCVLLAVRHSSLRSCELALHSLKIVGKEDLFGKESVSRLGVEGNDNKSLTVFVRLGQTYLWKFVSAGIGLEKLVEIFLSHS